MLVLSRHVGTSICIGDDITVAVLGSNRNQVRIGIQAPRNIPVYREEIYLRIQLKRMQAQNEVPLDESLSESEMNEEVLL